MKRGLNLRQLTLCDTLRPYKIPTIIRRTAGLCLAQNIRLSIRWIASETADEPSRFFLNQDLLRARRRCTGRIPHFRQGFVLEEGDNNRNPARPHKLTLRLLNLLCLDVPSYVMSSLPFPHVESLLLIPSLRNFFTFTPHQNVPQTGIIHMIPHTKLSITKLLN